VSAFWHERFDADPAIAWMRRQLFDLFAESDSLDSKRSGVALV